MIARLRLMTRDDVPAAMALKDAAGWNQTVADWERLLSAGPDGCFAAETDGDMVGVVTTFMYAEGLAWIGMMIVDSRHRRQGIGRALLEQAVRHLEARHVAAIRLDATPQGRPLYEKLGFVREYDIERWVLRRAGGMAPPPPVAGTQEIADVLRLDRRLFGADRSALLLSLAHEAPHFVLLRRHGDEVMGYTFGRYGTLADQLGPWVGRDRETAVTLLDEFLRRCSRDRVFVDCVRDQPWARSLLASRGFTPSRPLTRMVRGANPDPRPPLPLCAILGPEFG